MMKNKARFILPFLAVLCLMITLFSVTAFAEGEEAKIGSTTYATLKEALEASKDGDTITILKGVSWNETSPYTLSGKSITIDFDGNGIFTKKRFINIAEDAGLTLVDAYLNFYQLNWEEEYVFPSNAGTLTIVSTDGYGFYTSSNSYFTSVVGSNTGDIIIEGGTFNLYTAYVVDTIEAGGTVTVKDAEIIDEFNSFFAGEVKGELDIQNMTFTGNTVLNYVSGNGHAVFHDGNYDMKEEIVDAIAENGSVEFLGGTYKCKDKILEGIYDAGSVTFEDGSYTAKGIINDTYGEDDYPNTSQITFNGGTFTAEKYIVGCVYNKACITFNDGNFTAYDVINNFYEDDVSTNSAGAVFNGGVFNAGSTIISLMHGGSSAAFNGGEYNVDSDIIYEMYDTSSAEFTDGTYKSDQNIIANMYNESSAEFSGGTYTTAMSIVDDLMINSSVTFNDGDYTADDFIIRQMEDNASAEFINGSYEGDCIINRIIEKASAAFSDGTYDVGNDVISSMQGQSSAEFENGTYTASGSIVGDAYETASVTIHDGTYACGEPVIDSVGDASSLTINGGTMSSASSYALDDIHGTLKITGGNVTAFYDAIWMYNAGADISGGTFTSTNTTPDSGFSGMSVGGDSNVVLSGGTFISNCGMPGIMIYSGNVALADGYRYDPEDWLDTRTSVVSVIPVYVNVTFLDADGTEIYTEKIKNGESVENWPETPQAPSEGAIWNGWFDDDGNSYESDAAFTEDTELTASWTLRYKVTYDVTPDGTYGMPEEYPVPVDDKYYLPSEKVTPVSFPESFEGEAKDSKTGKTVKGTWAFSGWDKDEFEITEDTTISGSWTFTPDEPEPTEPESTDPTEPETPEEPTTPDNPQTGDRADMTGWLIALMAAAGITTICAARNKKQKKD